MKKWCFSEGQPMKELKKEWIQTMKLIENIKLKYKKHLFVFEELTKRDFKQKYKRTVLGMGWSVLSPLLMLLIMRVVFTQFFGRHAEHYTTYLFAGNIVMAFFREATQGGMMALMGNKHIFSRINVPKYLFLLSKNVSSIINFGLTLVVFFFFAALDGITFTWEFLLLIYPIFCLIVLNLGVGLILSALCVFFQDIRHLYDIFLMFLQYVSAIFYYVDAYPVATQRVFLANPVYCIITYIRQIVIENRIPSLEMHVLILVYALLVLGIGALIYKKKNHKFLYYV